MASKIETTPEMVQEVETVFQQNIDIVFSFVALSAMRGLNLMILTEELSSYVEQLKSESNVVITNQRHFEALQKSLEAVKMVEDAINHRISTELLAYELKNALEYLGEISGEFTNDEVLGNIFSKFCIGK